MECNPVGYWDLIIDSAALPGEGCQSGNPGQGPSPHQYNVTKDNETGQLNPTIITPKGGPEANQTLTMVEVNGTEGTPEGIEPGCAVHVVMTVKIDLPAFTPESEAGQQVLIYDYVLHYDASGSGSGLGITHSEFQTESGKIETPCTEDISATGNIYLVGP